MHKGIPFKMTRAESRRMYVDPKDVYVLREDETPVNMVHIELSTEEVDKRTKKELLEEIALLQAKLDGSEP